jgi:hypothetical protein
MKLILFGAAMLATFGLPAPAATISFSAPGTANGAFDVVVQAQNLFASRDPLTDGIISYGFNVDPGNPLLLTFNGATSGPLFDPATTGPGTNVFGAASGFGIFAPVNEPLTLATLHFTRVGAGVAHITISSDLSNPFQGIQFVNAPFAESIAGTVNVAGTSVPEPATSVVGAIGLTVLGIKWRLRRYSQRSALVESIPVARRAGI